MPVYRCVSREIEFRDMGAQSLCPIRDARTPPLRPPFLSVHSDAQQICNTGVVHVCNASVRANVPPRGAIDTLRPTCEKEHGRCWSTYMRRDIIYRYLSSYNDPWDTHTHGHTGATGQRFQRGWASTWRYCSRRRAKRRTALSDVAQRTRV